jgi:hypothetical protein
MTRVVASRSHNCAAGRHWGELDFAVAGDGRIWPLDSPAFGWWHQTWGRDRASGLWRVDVFREPHEAGTCWQGVPDRSRGRPGSAGR